MCCNTLSLLRPWPEGSQRPATAATWAFRFKPSHEGGPFLVCKQDPENGQLGGSEYAIWNGNADIDAQELHHFVGDGEDGDVHEPVKTGALNTGTWYFAVCWIEWGVSLNIQIDDGTIFSAPMTLEPPRSAGELVIGAKTANGSTADTTENGAGLVEPTEAWYERQTVTFGEESARTSHLPRPAIFLMIGWWCGGLHDSSG